MIFHRLIQEDPGPRNMFLKQVDLGELSSMRGVKGGVKLNPLRRKGKDEEVDMELVIDVTQRPDQAGEIGLKIPFWSKVEFKTSPPRLVIDIPDSDEEDLCERNEENPTRLAMCALNPKYLDKTAPFVDGIVSTDGKALTVRAIYNKNAKPSTCEPEIEMMGLGNWNIVRPNPEVDVNDFQSSANFQIQMGKVQLGESDYPKDTVLLRKESLEDPIALQPLEVPNVDLAFNFGDDLGPETRWNFSAKCQRSGIQTAVDMSAHIHPRTPTTVQAFPYSFYLPQYISPDPGARYRYEGNTKKNEDQEEKLHRSPITLIKDFSDPELEYSEGTSNKTEGTILNSSPEVSDWYLDTSSSGNEGKDSSNVTEEQLPQNTDETAEIQDTEIQTSSEISIVKESANDQEYFTMLHGISDILSTNELVLETIDSDESETGELPEDGSYIIVRRILEIVSKIQHVFIALFIKDENVERPSPQDRRTLIQRYHEALKDILRIVMHIQDLLKTSYWEPAGPHSTAERNQQYTVIFSYILENILDLLTGIQKASGVVKSPADTASKHSLKTRQSRTAQDAEQDKQRIIECINNNLYHIEMLKKDFERKSPNKAKSEELTSRRVMLRKPREKRFSTPELVPLDRTDAEVFKLQDFHSLMQNVLDIVHMIQKMLKDVITPVGTSPKTLSVDRGVRESHFMIHNISNVVSSVHSIFEDLYRASLKDSLASESKDFSSVENQLRGTKMLIQELAVNIKQKQKVLKDMEPTDEKILASSRCTREKESDGGSCKETSNIIQHFRDVLKEVQRLSDKADQTQSISSQSTAQTSQAVTDEEKRAISRPDFRQLVWRVLEDAYEEEAIIEAQSVDRLRKFSKGNLSTSKSNLKLTQAINESLLEMSSKIQEMIEEPSINLSARTSYLREVASSSGRVVLASVAEVPAEDARSQGSSSTLSQKEKLSSLESSVEPEFPSRQDPVRARYQKQRRLDILSDFLSIPRMKVAALDEYLAPWKQYRKNLESVAPSETQVRFDHDKFASAFSEALRKRMRNRTYS